LYNHPSRKDVALFESTIAWIVR